LPFIKTITLFTKGDFMEVSTQAFGNGQRIPSKHGCLGENSSPPLQIDNIPKETVTFAIIVEDPDAPNGTFDHWVAWNIPPAKILEGGIKVPEQGVNSFGSVGYRGPCPPPGSEHRYFFRVFALDTKLDLPAKSPKKDLKKAMEGHILAEAEVMGTYQR
jgi:Raf kinase inhibitor-like YbhB/YbcL family protein